MSGLLFGHMVAGVGKGLGDYTMLQAKEEADNRRIGLQMEATKGLEQWKEEFKRDARVKLGKQTSEALNTQVEAWKQANPGKEISAKDYLRIKEGILLESGQDTDKIDSNITRLENSEREAVTRREMAQERNDTLKALAALKANGSGGGGGGSDPAEVKTAEWMIKNGIATSPSDAWDRVRRLKEKSPESTISEIASKLVSEGHDPKDAVKKARGLYDELSGKSGDKKGGGGGGSINFGLGWKN